MSNKVNVAKAEAVRPGEMMLVHAAGTEYALCNVDGRYHAVLNECPHQGGPLAEGYLDGHRITCPWHSWSFDLTNGQCEVKPTVKATCVPVLVENGEIFLEL